MNRHSPTIESIKENIRYLQELIGEGTITMPQYSKIDTKEFSAEIEKTPYHEFIVFADYHYFVSRILFVNSLDLYSFFASQQCIENYFKAYIRFKNKIPERTHNLIDLLESCRKNATKSEEFIFGDDIYTIIYKYDPFNDFSRYPVSRTKINGYGSSFADDIYILDYFVYKFREVMPFPVRYRDLLQGDHFYLNSCINNSPLLFKMFKENNINFFLSK